MSIVNSRSKFPSLFEKVKKKPCSIIFLCHSFRLLQGFVLRPGHENLVAMSAISTVADDAIKQIDAKDRDCYFQDEYKLVRRRSVHICLKYIVSPKLQLHSIPLNRKL